MNNTQSDLFVHGLRSLMTQIGMIYKRKKINAVFYAYVVIYFSVIRLWQLSCPCRLLQPWMVLLWEVDWSWPWPVTFELLVSY